MKRLQVTLAVFAAVVVISLMAALGLGPGRSAAQSLRAGFAAVRITPPAGTRLSGFGDRDFRPEGAMGIHDDLFVRALYLAQGKKEALIMGFDLLFFTRGEADRFKGAIGDRLGLAPADILLNTSHTHTGPKVGNWYYTPADDLYLDALEKRIVEAAVEAKARAAAATLWAGETRTSVPLSRRLVGADGKAQFAPNPAGAVYDRLPFVMVKAADGSPVSLVFSVSCHASTIKGDERADQVSADYPGAAAAALDRALGKTCALFLQGAGGDAKPSVVGQGLKEWRAGTWEDLETIGRTIAAEIETARAAGLKEIKPALRTALVEMALPLGPAPGRDELRRVLEETKPQAADTPWDAKARGLWAEEQLSLLDRGFGLAAAAPVLVQGVELGEGLRLVGVEGELTADLGRLIHDFYGGGVTFPLGYANGARMYLPSSRMIDEGGYEVESYWEYRQPAPLAKGVEAHYTAALGELKRAGIR